MAASSPRIPGTATRRRSPMTPFEFFEASGDLSSDQAAGNHWGWAPPPVGRPRAQCHHAAGGPHVTSSSDESPARYSLAGCSPAEPTSASPATSRVARPAILSPGSCVQPQVSTFAFVSEKGSVHSFAPAGPADGFHCPGLSGFAPPQTSRNSRPNESHTFLGEPGQVKSSVFVRVPRLAHPHRADML